MIGITIISLAVGAVVWASSEHSSIEDKIRATYIDKEFSRTVFAPKEDVVRLDQRAKNIEENIDKINNSLDNVENKLDKLINLMLRGNNRDDRQDN
jgi:ppGpp synthetase/RelA/SpoT-type nucleotidyltranferase